jgi:hypothetical protein
MRSHESNSAEKSHLQANLAGHLNLVFQKFVNIGVLVCRKRLTYHSRVPSLSIPNLCLPLHHLLLLPNILPAHSPREAKTTNCRARSQIENTVHTLTVSDQHTCQFILRDYIPYRRRAGGNHHLGIDGGSVSRQLRPQTIGEDRLREGEEDGAAEGLAEHDEGHGDCDYCYTSARLQEICKAMYKVFSSKALIISLATGTRPQPNSLAASTFFNQHFA